MTSKEHPSACAESRNPERKRRTQGAHPGAQRLNVRHGLTRTSLAAIALGVLFLTGCSSSLVGSWKMVDATPNKALFSVDDVSFARNKTFTATVTRNGKTIEESGTYRFNGFRLYLHPEAGGCREFGAVRKFTTLELMDGDRTVVLKKR